MDRLKMLVVILMLAAAVLTAQPKLAVLDAVLEEGLDPAIRVPITEKIIEQAVASGKYLVLDRANVTQVLEEKEFQVSGLVKNTEIKKAGEYLGANFVGVARVSKVGETYFISAKIIDVETGAIAVQASAEKKGDADVVFALATTVGTKLMGGKLTEQEEAVLVEDKPAKVEREGGLFAPKGSKTGARSHVVLNFLYPFYFGGGVDYVDTIHTDEGYTFDLWYDDWWAVVYGIDLHYLQVFLRNFYASLSLSYAVRDFETETPLYYYATDFDTIDIRANAGGIFQPIPNLQVYGGVGVGYIMQTFGDYWVAEGATETGLLIGGEIGADYILFRLLSVSVRASLALASAMSAWEFYSFEESLGFFGLQIGAGIAY